MFWTKWGRICSNGRKCLQTRNNSEICAIIYEEVHKSLTLTDAIKWQKKGRRGILYEIADPFIRQGLAQQRWDRIHHKSIPRGMRVSGQHPYSRRSDHIDRIAKEHRESISAPWGMVTECRMIRPRDGVYRFWWTLFFWLNLTVCCVIL